MTEPQGNLMILVCKPCQQAGEKDFGVKLAVRSRIGWYEHLVPSKQFDNWLAHHAKCGGRTNPDHFGLGYSFGLDHDQSALEASVKLAVVQ